MKKNNTLAGLARYAKKSPKWYYFILPAIIILLIDYLIIKNITIISIIIFSYLILTLIDFTAIKSTNKSFNHNRIIYMGFASFVLSNLFFWIAYSINVFISTDVYYILALSIGFPSFLRFLILYVYYPDYTFEAFFISMDYTYSFIIISVLFYSFLLKNILYIIIPLIISTLIYVLFSYLFIKITTVSFSKKYHSKPSELINFFLNKTNGGDVGEKFFKKVYNKKTRVPVKTINIMDNDKSKVTLIFPYVHPGPFGDLCTSDLPVKLKNELDDDNIMVFHTATTNSNNCSGKDDIKNIAIAVKNSIGNMKYNGYISDFVKFNVNGYDVTLQKFGNFGFSAIIPGNKRFDDISLKAGLKLIKGLKNSGAEDFALIDAQNKFTKNADELNDCSIFINPLIKKFNETRSKYPAMIGYSKKVANMNGLASMGIQSIVMKIDDKYNAIVLTDSNNITEEIIKDSRYKLKNRVASLDIYTTDNHAVNASNLDINPLGKNCDVNEVSNLIREAVMSAINNVSMVKVGMDTQYVNVTMGEDNSFHDLISTVLLSIKKAKYSIAFVLFLSILISIFLFKELIIFL